MRKILPASIFVLTFCVFAFGQNSNCPAISVTGPQSVVEPDENMDFTASVSDIDSSKIGYKWTVSEGKIIEGQGTSKILVDTKGLYDNVIKATVEILNLPEECNSSASDVGVLAAFIHYPVIDDFGKLSKIDEKERLEALVPELRKNPDKIAYFILYYPEKNGQQNFVNRAGRIQKLLIKENKIPFEQVVIINGGVIIINGKKVNDERTTIFLIPAGAEPPIP